MPDREPAGASTDVVAIPESRRFRRAPVVLFAIAVVIVISDQITKLLAVEMLQDRPPVEIIGETVRLLLVRNPGAAFSFGTDFTIVFGILSVVVVLAISWYAFRVRSKWWTWGLGLVLGGAAGNLIDRIFRDPGGLQGHVVDFVSVGWWPVFNVADSCLVAGVIVLVVTSLLGEDTNGLRDKDVREAREAEGAESPEPRDG